MTSEKEKQRKRDYYWQHRDKMLLRAKKYYQEHKKAYYEYSRRAWLKNRPAPLTPEQRSLVMTQAIHKRMKKELENRL